MPAAPLTAQVEGDGAFHLGGRSPLGVIFDCDGTLLDSMGMWHSLDDRLAARVGIAFTKADRDYMTSATIPECSAYMHDRYGIGSSARNVEDMIASEISTFYRDEVQARPGALAFVRALDAADVPMAVASSTPSDYLRLGLATAGFEPYMRAIVSVDDVSRSKRDPAVYDAARAALGTTREQTWGFEDALYAVRTLKTAGYRTCAIYDSDIAGTPDDLRAAADLFIMSFDGLRSGEFLRMAALPR